MEKFFSALSAALFLALLVSCSNPSGGGSDDNGNVNQRVTYTSESSFTIESTGTITNYTGTDTVINIPPTIGGVKVLAIGDNAFKDKTTITSVTIPDSVSTIGTGAFRNCSKLASVEIPESVTVISGGAFADCMQLTSITLPSSLTVIGNGVFDDCRGLTSITIPDSVTSIGTYAFYACTGLTSIVIPKSITVIKDGTFKDCLNLRTITIGISVATIEGYAFDSCPKLSEMIVNPPIPPTFLNISNTFSSGILLTIKVPSDKVTAYKKTDWAKYPIVSQSK